MTRRGSALRLALAVAVLCCIGLGPSAAGRRAPAQAHRPRAERSRAHLRRSPRVARAPSLAPRRTRVADRMAVLTSNSALQAKLDQLKSLAEGNFIDNFVKEFVPSDLEEEDLVEFTKRQKDFPEEWENLKSEIFAIATGTGVTRIEGDQTTTAVFYFRHPKVEQMDREVVFVCTDGDWRAEG